MQNRAQVVYHMHQCKLHFILLDLRRHAGGHQRAALKPSRRSAVSGGRKLRFKSRFRPDPAVAVCCRCGRIFSAAHKAALEPGAKAGPAAERGPTPGCVISRSNTRPAAWPAMPPPSPTDSTPNAYVFDSLFRSCHGRLHDGPRTPSMAFGGCARAERRRWTGPAGSGAYG